MRLFFAEHLYFLSSLYFLLCWAILFISFRKDKKTQKKILITSLILMVVTPFVEHINLTDWWSPVFIWDIFFHIEDLIFGFGITGTILGIYFWVSRKVRFRIEKQVSFSRPYKRNLLIITVLLMFLPFYFLHISSFYSEVLCMIFLITCVFIRVPAMILSSIMTGVILTVIILPGYFLGTYLHPGWIQEYWLLSGWPGKLLLTVPLGEYVYYTFSGLFISAFQELWFSKNS